MKKILLLAFLGLIVTSAQSCSQGQLKINGSCATCNYIPGCVQYGLQGTCNICSYGYQSVDGGCQLTDKLTTSCCIQTDNNGACLQCAPGLYLDGNSCYKIERPGCLETQGNACSNCANGYQNVNGRCFKTIDSCAKYNDKGLCSECFSGYQLIRGLCNALILFPSIQNCKTSNEYGCVACKEGFYLTKDRSCAANQIGCIKHFREACQVCLPGFKLVNGKCLMDGCSKYSSNGCIACSSSAYSLVDGRCLLDNCLESLNGQCVVCHKDYRYKNGVCVKAIADRCISCANGYFISTDGKCYKSILGCKTYSNDGTCSVCLDIFVNNNGVCTIPGCEKIGLQGCEVCTQPFRLSSGRCVLENCNEYNYGSKKCKSCKIGYHVEGGLCVANKPQCQSYAFSGDNEVCSACNSPDIYILTDLFNCEQRKPGCVYQYGKCISCAYPFKRGADGTTCVIDGCSQYSLTGCVTCSSPFQLNLGACIISNCDQIVNSQCTKCSSGYHLSAGICVQDDSKCTSYLADKCQGCINGYKLSVSGLCVRDILNCKVLNADGCAECNIGYQVVLGQCVVVDKYCSVFDTRGKGCAKCITGYHTQSGICTLNDPKCSSYCDPTFTQYCTQCAAGYVFSANGTICVQQIPGCIYDNKGNCASCKSPFKMVGQSCVILGCSKYSDSGCYQCGYPFQLNGNSCIIPFCSVYNANTCTQCQSGYKLIQGQCYREDPKCTEYNKNGQCISCINEYIIFSGVCVKKDDNCQVYSKLGGCNTCKDKYYLSPDFICLPQQPGCVYQQGKCAYCNYPFKFNDEAQKCRIDGCLQATNAGCIKCQFPFTISDGICQISNCVTVQDNHCVRCTPGYHLKQGMTCVINDKNCLRYNDDGDCELCDKGYLRMSSGECELAEDNCIDKKKTGQCVACKDGFYVNTFYQCQKKDPYCKEYNNGVCSRCDDRHFLYQLICFPYSPGCVAYSGKDCIKCKSAYTLKNGQCFALKKPSLQLQGEGDQYDFDITPIDITKSKYYIDNLSPICALAKVFYSSFQTGYTDPRLDSENENLYTKGWKAENARSGEYIGYILDDNSDPVTFYAIQIQDVEGNYIQSFYIEYSIDGVNYIRVSILYDSSDCNKNLTTIYFTGLYAKAIRIVVKGYYGWPAAKIEFFYYDVIRFKKISNLKSLTYLQESIQSVFVDRMDNQIYINQREYFQPNKSCQNSDVCFTGLQLCQSSKINSLSISCNGGTLKSVYITYSTDGQNFNCYQQCKYVSIDQTKSSNTVLLNQLLAKNIRVYPAEWSGTPSIHISYSYV